MSVWEWISTTTTIDSIFSTLGLGALAVLFATNRILTRGQHETRIADLKAHHERELKQKDATYNAMKEADATAYSEMRASRDYYRGARFEEKARADRATEQLLETNEIARAATHALTALSEVAAEGAAT